MTGSLACSLAVVGWLGFGAYQVEEAVWTSAAFAVQGDTLAPIQLLTPEARPRMTLIAAGGGEEDATSPAGAQAEAEQNTSKVLDIGPTPSGSTAVGALHAMLRRAGHSQWSTERLQGVLGHAFSFAMREGAGKVWQESNLDWGRFFDMLPEVGYRFQRFEATQRGSDRDFSKLKANAWAAVRASIDRGIPAAAWCPMSPEQKADGVKAYEWGLLLGYDESDETYTVRHRNISGGREAFTVRYDAIGHIDSVEWFCVLVYDGPEPVDAKGTHLTALRNAVAFANGTRFEPEDILYPADARGFAAYGLWREAIESGVAAPKHSQYHAGELRAFRGHAASYLRELVDIFPDVAADLEAGAAHYDRLIETSAKLHDFCAGYRDAEVFPEDTGVEAAAMVAAALQAERDAIARIEAALAVLDESP